LLKARRVVLRLTEMATAVTTVTVVTVAGPRLNVLRTARLKKTHIHWDVFLCILSLVDLGQLIDQSGGTPSVNVSKLFIDGAEGIRPSKIDTMALMQANPDTYTIKPEVSAPMFSSSLRTQDTAKLPNPQNLLWNQLLKTMNSLTMFFPPDRRVLLPSPASKIASAHSAFELDSRLSCSNKDKYSSSPQSLLKSFL
jgi:hypothetical protein